MIKIIEVKGKVTTACTGMNGYDSEVTVEAIDESKNSELFYVCANYFEDYSFAVTKNSVFDYVTNNTDDEPENSEPIEYYSKTSEYNNSQFKDALKLAKTVIDAMMK